MLFYVLDIIVIGQGLYIEYQSFTRDVWMVYLSATTIGLGHEHLDSSEVKISHVIGLVFGFLSAFIFVYAFLKKLKDWAGTKVRDLMYNVSFMSPRHDEEEKQDERMHRNCGLIDKVVNRFPNLSIVVMKVVVLFGYIVAMIETKREQATNDHHLAEVVRRENRYIHYADESKGAAITASTVCLQNYTSQLNGTALVTFDDFPLLDTYLTSCATGLAEKAYPPSKEYFAVNTWEFQVGSTSK